MLNAKKASEKACNTEKKLNELISVLSQENLFLKSSVQSSDNHLKLARTELMKMQTTENKSKKEMQVLRMNLENNKKNMNMKKLAMLKN